VHESQNEVHERRVLWQERRRRRVEASFEIQTAWPRMRGEREHRSVYVRAEHCANVWRQGS